MKSHEAIGKKIVKVLQKRFYNDTIRAMDVDVEGFELDDGTRLFITTIETENGEYAHAIAVNKKGKHRRE